MRCARKGSLVGSLAGSFRRTENVTCETSMNSYERWWSSLKCGEPTEVFYPAHLHDFWNGVETSDGSRLLVKAWVGANIKG